MLVAAFAPEPSRDLAIRWLTGLPSGELTTNRWCETEIASALALKVRTGELKADKREHVFDLIVDVLRAKARFVAISGDHFDRATRILRRSERPLRGGDALHLAIAAEVGATLWTLDRRMAEAGQALGLGTRLLA